MPRTGSGQLVKMCICGVQFRTWPSQNHTFCSKACADTHFSILFKERYRLHPESHPMIGRVESVEWRASISRSGKGKSGAPKGSPGFRGKHTEETKDKLRLKRMGRRIPRANTGFEKAFKWICKKYHLPFKYVGDGQVWIGRVNPDFIDYNGKKVAVEIFGDYWHTPLFRQTALKPSYTEQGRRALLKQYGWKLIVIWASEFKLPNATERILSRLRQAGYK